MFEVIGYVYQYIKLLRQVAPQVWIFKELQDIANMDFLFAEEQPQDEYAAELAGYLLIVTFYSTRLWYSVVLVGFSLLSWLFFLDNNDNDKLCMVLKDAKVRFAKLVIEML